MLSVLVPTYNYNVYPLVREIHKQAIKANKPFEILVFDDASTQRFKTDTLLQELSFVTYKKLSKNLGRTATRQELALAAQYDNLLFMDADTFPKNPDFLTKIYTFLMEGSAFEVLFGGVVFQENKPKQEQLLRWTYGKSREALSLEKRLKAPYLSLISTSFLIKKPLFLTVNKALQYKRYGLDILFSYLLKEQKVVVKHIDNPIYHFGLETSLDFIKKSEKAIDTSIFLVQENLLPSTYRKIDFLNKKYAKFGTCFLAKTLFILFHKLMIIQLKSSKPSLRIFDLYRYGYYCLKK